MATTTLGTLAVKLRADTKEFAIQMKGAATSMQGVADKAKTVAIAAGVAFAALSGVGLIAVKMAAEFESGMVRVKAVAQATDEQFNQLRSSALDLALATKFTAREVAEGMGFMAMAGFKANEIIKTMPSVLNLAAAGMIDLGTAADITTNILTGMGLKVGELGKVNDILVSAMTGANVNTRMLGNSFKFVGPVARSAGIAFEEITSAIALLGNAGIQGSTAGTTLRFAITRLVKPVGQAGDIIKMLGIQTKDSTGKILPLVDIIEQLEDVGATTAEVMGLFGLRAGPGMSSLIDQGADSLREFTQRLKDSGGIADRVAKENLATLTGRLLILQSGVETAAISIGDMLIPISKDLVSVVQGMIGWFNDLSSSTKKWITGIGAAVTGLTGLLFAAASVVAILPILITFVGSLATVTGTLAVALAAAAPWILAIGVAAATAAVFLVGYREISKTTTSDIGLMWKQLGEDIKDALGIPEGEVESVSMTISDMFDALMADIKGLWDEAMDYIAETGLGRLLKNIVGFAKESLGQWSWLGDEITKLFDSVIDDVVKLWDWVADSYFGQLAINIIQTFVDIWKGVLKVFIIPFKIAFSAIGEAISFWGKKLGFFKGDLAELTTSGEPATGAPGAPGAPDRPDIARERERERRRALADKGRAKAAKGVTEAAEGMAKGMHGAIDPLKELADASIATAKAVRDDFAGVTQRLLEMADKTMGGIDALIDRRLLAGGTGGAAGLAPLAVPKVRIGRAPEEDPIVDEVKKIAKTIADSLREAGNTLVDGIIAGSETLGEVIEGAKEGMKTGGPWGAVIGAIVVLLQKTEFFASLIDVVNDILGSVIGLFDQILSAFKPLLEMVGEFVTTIIDLVFDFLGLNAAFNIIGGVVKLITGVLGIVLEVIRPLLGILGLFGGKIGDVITRLLGINKAVFALSRAVGWVAEKMMNAAQWIRRMWNKMIEFFADLAGKISSSLAKTIRKAKISFIEMRDAAGGEREEREERDGGLDDDFGNLGETVRSLNASLTNIPEGFKVRAARFQAIDVGGPGGMEALGGQSQVTINITVDDIESAAERISDVIEAQNNTKTGSIIGGLPWGTDTGGA